MSWENKILRIVRVANAQEIGTFGSLLTAITVAGETLAISYCSTRAPIKLCVTSRYLLTTMRSWI